MARVHLDIFGKIFEECSRSIDHIRQILHRTIALAILRRTLVKNSSSGLRITIFADLELIGKPEFKSHMQPFDSLLLVSFFLKILPDARPHFLT